MKVGKIRVGDAFVGDSSWNCRVKGAFFKWLECSPGLFEAQQLSARHVLNSEIKNCVCEKNIGNERHSCTSEHSEGEQVVPPF